MDFNIPLKVEYQPLHDESKFNLIRITGSQKTLETVYRALGVLAGTFSRQRRSTTELELYPYAGYTEEFVLQIAITAAYIGAKFTDLDDFWKVRLEVHFSDLIFSIKYPKYATIDHQFVKQLLSTWIHSEAVKKLDTIEPSVNLNMRLIDQDELESRVNLVTNAIRILKYCDPDKTAIGRDAVLKNLKEMEVYLPMFQSDLAVATELNLQIGIKRDLIASIIRDFKQYVSDKNITNQDIYLTWQGQLAQCAKLTGEIVELRSRFHFNSYVNVLRRIKEIAPV